VLAVDAEVAASCRSCLTTVSVRLGEAYGCVDWLWLSTALSTAPGFVHTACRSPNTLKFEDGEDAGWLGRALAVLESKAPCISSCRSTPYGQSDRNKPWSAHPNKKTCHSCWAHHLVVSMSSQCLVIYRGFTSWNLWSKPTFQITTL